MMQIQLVLRRVFAARQSLQYALGHVVAAITRYISGQQRRSFQRALEFAPCIGLVAVAHARLWFRSWFLRPGRCCRQLANMADRRAEQGGIVVRRIVQRIVGGGVGFASAVAGSHRGTG